MASYHRVLETFGRSIRDMTLECDCDVHPWEVSINGEQWAGKLRLIGFVDVFFLISYSANARFEHGIIVYKDKLALEELAGNIPKLGEALAQNDNGTNGTEPEENLDEVQGPNEEPKSKQEETQNTGDKNDEENVAPEFRETSSYSIQSLGHPVGLRASYPKSWIRSYKVEITKPCTWALNKRIMRGLKPHSTYDLMNDVLRCQIITQGQLAGHVMGVLLAGSHLDDTTKKYIEGLTSGDDAGRQALSNEKI